MAEGVRQKFLLQAWVAFMMPTSAGEASYEQWMQSWGRCRMAAGIDVKAGTCSGIIAGISHTKTDAWTRLQTQVSTTPECGLFIASSCFALTNETDSMELEALAGVQRGKLDGVCGAVRARLHFSTHQRAVRKEMKQCLHAYHLGLCTSRRTLRVACLLGSKSAV